MYEVNNITWKFSLWVVYKMHKDSLVLKSKKNNFRNKELNKNTIKKQKPRKKISKKIFNLSFYVLINQLVSFELSEHTILEDCGFIVSLVEENKVLAIGLLNVEIGNLIFFDNGNTGIVINVQKNEVLLIIWESDSTVLEGSLVSRDSNILNSSLFLKSFSIKKISKTNLSNLCLKICNFHNISPLYDYIMFAWEEKLNIYISYNHSMYTHKVGVARTMYGHYVKNFEKEDLTKRLAAGTNYGNYWGYGDYLSGSNHNISIKAFFESALFLWLGSVVCIDFDPAMQCSNNFGCLEIRSASPNLDSEYFMNMFKFSSLPSFIVTKGHGFAFSYYILVTATQKMYMQPTREYPPEFPLIKSYE